MTKEELVELLKKHTYKVKREKDKTYIYAKGALSNWKVGEILEGGGFDAKAEPINLVENYDFKELSLLEIEDLIHEYYWFVSVLLEEPEFNSKGEDK